jgi:hypothetical protein
VLLCNKYLPRMKLGAVGARPIRAEPDAKKIIEALLRTMSGSVSSSLLR